MRSLGNWVRSVQTGEYRQLDWIAMKHISDGNIQSIYDRSPVYEPIKLTPEILRKIGFIESGFGSFVIRFNKDIVFKELSIASDYLYIREGEPDQPRHYDDLVTLWNRDKNPELFTVHNLQNLWFTITGEELEIKL